MVFTVFTVLKIEMPEYWKKGLSGIDIFIVSPPCQSGIDVSTVPLVTDYSGGAQLCS
jgi:hypothetical protein